MLAITTKCPICGAEDEIILDEAGQAAFKRWQNRELLIQDAFPDMSADKREQLITGICPCCWSEMFGESNQ